MKRYLIPLIALILVGVLSYRYSLVSFLLLAVIVLSLTVLLVVGVVRIFSSGLNPRWLRVPLIITAVCVAGVLVGMLSPLEPAVVSSGSVSDKLSYAYKTDQADRRMVGAYLGIFKDTMVKRDSIRLAQVNHLYKDKQINLPIDKFYAAFIFHHGKKSLYYGIAQELAREAASVRELKNNYVVQWLAKASYDRWMVSLGEPEKYGTQDKFSVSVK